jgi:2-oxoglutarate ferredoxin oxidoreductase subunit gamma
VPAAGTRKATRRRHELRLSGSGGQGILLAATLLAEAATSAGHEVVMTQSYGPEARGGASKAEVIVSAEPIDFPEVTAPDLTLCLSQEAFDAYAELTRPGGTVVFDERLVESRPIAGVGLVPAPLAQTAIEAAGAEIVTNVVALGLVQKVAGVVTRAALEAALRRRLPPRLLELNLRALRLGAGLAGDSRRAATATAKRRRGGDAAPRSRGDGRA